MIRRCDLLYLQIFCYSKFDLWKSGFGNEIFWCQEFICINFDLKITVKIYLRIKTKNHTADPEIGFLTKSISKPYGRATAMPTAWEITKVSSNETWNLLIECKWRLKFGFRCLRYQMFKIIFHRSLVCPLTRRLKFVM